MGYADTYASNHAAILRDLGRSQAEAKLRSGDAWAGAIGNIGNIAASVPGQLADERRSRQQEAIWQANLDKFNQQRQEDQWLKDAMNSSVDPSTGDIDERRLSENLSMLGAAELAPRALQTVREGKEAALRLKNAMQTGQINDATMAKMQSDALAPYAKALIESEGDPAVLNAALAAIGLNLGPQMAEALRQSIAKNPEGVLPFAQSLLKPEEPQKPVVVGEGAALVGPDGKVVYENAKPEAAQTLDQMLAAALKVGDRVKVNEIIKVKAQEANATRAPQQGPAPTYQWVTLPDGSQKLMSANEIRSTPGAAPPSASRSADAPASVKSELASIGTLTDMLTQIETVGKENNWKGIGGFGVGAFNDFMKKNVGRGPAGEQELRNTISNVLAEIAKLRGGTAFTAQEQQLLERYTPTINESAESVMGKVKSLKSFLATKQRNIEQQFMGNAPARAGGAGSGGGAGAPSKDPLGIRGGG